jgi:hypothetical protein
MPANHESSAGHDLALDACAVAVIAFAIAAGEATLVRRCRPRVSAYYGRIRTSPEVPPPQFLAAP